MLPITSREIRLLSRPSGLPTAANFELASRQLEPLGEDQVLVRNHFISVDPYMRGRMNETKSYVPPFRLNEALEGGAVGEVVESRSPQYKPGDIVTSRYGWREWFIAAPGSLHRVSAHHHPLSVYLGTLGMTGMTAWAGLKLVDVKSGDIVFISGAAGAVGSVAGQLAKLAGCTVIGSAGSDEKARFLKDECGFDEAFNYNEGPLRELLKKAAPEGINVYFDNVGGDALEAALSALLPFGRIIACGSISGYNEKTAPPGPSNLFNVITKRLTIKGFIVSDFIDRLPEFEGEVGGWLSADKLKHRETVVKGIDKAVDAFLGLFKGGNIGKMVVDVR